MDLSKPGLTKAEVEKIEYDYENKIHFSAGLQRLPTCAFKKIVKHIWRKRFEKRLPEYVKDYGQPTLLPEWINAMLEYQATMFLRPSILEVIMT